MLKNTRTQILMQRRTNLVICRDRFAPKMSQLFSSHAFNHIMKYITHHILPSTVMSYTDKLFLEWLCLY